MHVHVHVHATVVREDDSRARPQGLYSTMTDLIIQVPLQLLLVDCLIVVERDIGCARPRTSPLSQGGRDVVFLAAEGPFADAQFAEPISILRLSA